MKTKIEQTITEQLISFRTAKLADEKGFDEWTYNAFTLNGEDSEISYNPKRKARLKLYAKPTQAFLQRWLREKYNYHIILIIDEIDFKYESRVYRWKDEPDFIFGMNGSKSFQQTLEKALYNTLLLIKQTQ